MRGGVAVCACHCMRGCERQREGRGELLYGTALVNGHCQHCFRRTCTKRDKADVAERLGDIISPRVHVLLG